jgi:hypothetical protein
MNDHPASLPLDSLGAPLPPRAQPGYYPGFSTLAQQGFWDAATRDVILERISNIPAIRFFCASDAALLETVVEHVLPQTDRAPERRISIVPYIDERLHAGRIAGYRFEEMPPDGEAHRLGLRAMEQMALAGFGVPFLQLTWREQEALLKSIHDGQPFGAEAIWKRMPVHRYWALLVSDCVEVYYAHPWAWDEIGYGGPAYPRGYVRLEGGEPEPWEVEERRYQWQAPAAALSDDDQERVATHQHQPAHGQGGTH